MEILIATFLDMLVAVMATEAITQLLTKSEFSSRFLKKPLFKYRKKIKFFQFIHDGLDCGYCTSVWAAILPAVWFFTDSNVLGIVMTVLIFHRLSNVLHFIIDFIDLKRPRELDLEELIEKEKTDEKDEFKEGVR